MRGTVGAPPEMETTREMSLAGVVRKMWQVSRAEHFDPEQVATLRRGRLQRLLRHVLARSRFYAQYYRAHGITPGVLNEVQLADLPRVNKEMLMANFDDVACDPAITRAGVEEFLRGGSPAHALYRGRYHVVHTSGTTGSLGIFVYGRRDWEVMQALAGTRILRYRPPGRRLRYAFVVKTDGHFGGVSLCGSAPWIAFKRLPLSTDAPLEQTLAAAQRFRPDLLVGYGSALCLLAQQQRAGRLHLHPSRVICSGEALTGEMTRTLQEAFGVLPLDLYAACESLTIGVSCRHSRGIHLFDDWHCLELVDAQGRPAGPACPGRLILTNLYNYALPLIRYEMNDEIAPATSPCPCGWPFARVQQIAGRTEEILWFKKPDGTQEYLHPFAVSGLHLPGVRRWQLVQTAPQELTLRLQTTGAAQSAVTQARAALEAMLRAKRLDQLVSLRMELTDEIRSDPRTGKCRLVIPCNQASHGSGL